MLFTLFLCYFQTMIPLLKYLSSDVYTEEHWHDMFRMLKMPQGTSLDRLTFGSILACSDDIVAHATELKVG